MPNAQETPVENCHEGINSAFIAIFAKPFVHAVDQKKRGHGACLGCLSHEAEPTKYERGLAPDFATTSDWHLIQVQTKGDAF